MIITVLGCRLDLGSCRAHYGVLEYLGRDKPNANPSLGVSGHRTAYKGTYMWYMRHHFQEGLTYFGSSKYYCVRIEVGWVTLLNY